MRIIVTADLHYDIQRSREPARAVAREIRARGADILLVLGDVAGRDVSIVREALGLFDPFSGQRLFVAGNHDVWTNPGECSLERHERLLPAICRESGFHPLEAEPLLIGGVGFVGSMGWYDYGYRPAWLNVPLRFYREKIAPGAAARLARYEHLLAEREDVPEPSLRIGARWMDGEHVRLPMSDVDFCHRLLERFTAALAEMGGRSECIVAGLHHVPFAGLVPAARNPSWAFAAAYLGSELFGEAMLAEPKVRYAFCGHSHLHGRLQAGHVECVNVGSTYVRKRYEVLEL